MTGSRQAVRTFVRGTGQGLVTLGFIVLLFLAYELWFTNYTNSREQHHITGELKKAWDNGKDPLATGDDPVAGDTGKLPLPGAKLPTVKLGTGIAIIRIPELGVDYARTIVEGTGQRQLAEGPGHYAASALPGRVGNFAVAGHRVSKGSPFLNLDRLHAGDAIVIETRNIWYTYRMLGNGSPPGKSIVDPSDGAVVDPVPNHPGQKPTRRLITLTTCNPKFSAAERLIIHGVLDSARPKSDGLPPALANE